MFTDVAVSCVNKKDSVKSLMTMQTFVWIFINNYLLQVIVKQILDIPNLKRDNEVYSFILMIIDHNNYKEQT